MNRLLLLAAALLCLPLAACSQSGKGQEELVVYVSVDQVIAQPVLDAFEEETGIKVLAVLDVEATKTTGLVNRLIAEKSAPKADVFWSGESAQTQLLEREGVLEEGYLSFGGRARILLVNTDLVPEVDYPASLRDLLDPKYTSVAIANPVFGTTSTHAAALYDEWGAEEARAFFRALKEREAVICDGNSVVRDKVASGEAAVGLTDTDDAYTAVRDGKPVKILYPDQGEGEMGAFLIPNTVALVRGGSNSQQARRFIEYLTSDACVAQLAETGWFLPPEDLERLRPMEIDFLGLGEKMEQVRTDMTELFVT